MTDTLTPKLNAGKMLLDTLLGSSSSQTTSGGTSTKGLDISQAGIDALLKSILEGTGGLADVAKGEKASGMYNSTVNTQMINDLLTRSAGTVAKLSAKEVSTTPDSTITKVQNPQIPQAVSGTAILGMLLQSAAAKAGGKVADTAVTKLLGPAPRDTTGAVSSATKSIKNAITGDVYDSATADAVWSAGADRYDPAIADSIWSESANQFSSEAADAIWSESATVAPELADSMADGMGGSLGDVGGYASYFGAANDFFSGDNKTAAVGQAIGTYFGGPIGGAIGSKVGEAVAPVFDAIDDSIIHPVVDFAEDTWESVTGVFDDCYITTAVAGFSGKPDNCFELSTMRKFRDSYMMRTASLRQEVIDYYSYAPTLVAKINSFGPALASYIYASMDFYFIQPCVDAFNAGDAEGAYKKYKQLIAFAKGI